MQFFDRPNRAKIALRGSSSRPPSSEQLLARAKYARSQRAQQRAQHAAASKLQAAFRRRAAFLSLPHELSPARPAEGAHVALRQLLFIAPSSVLVCSSPDFRAPQTAASLATMMRPFVERLVTAGDIAAGSDISVVHSGSAAPSEQTCLTAATIRKYVSEDDSLPLSEHMVVTALGLLLSYLVVIGNADERHSEGVMRMVCALASSLSSRAVQHLVHSSLYNYIAAAFQVWNSHARIRHLLCEVVLTTAQLLRADNVSENESLLLHRKLGLSLLCQRDSPSLFPWKENEGLVQEVLRAVAVKDEADVNGVVAASEKPSVSDLSMQEAAVMLSNVLELGEGVWSGHDREFVWGYVAVLSALLEALPETAMMEDGSDEDEDDEKDDDKSESMDGGEVLSMRQHERETLREVMKTLRVSLNRIVSEDTVRMLLTAAVGEGRAAVVRVCQLFNFLTRRDKSLSSSLQNALAFWRTSQTRKAPHILNSLWKMCLNDGGDDSMSDVNANSARGQLRDDAAPILLVFSSAYSYLLYIQDVDEMFETKWPFSMEEVREVVLVLKPYLFHALYVKPTAISVGSGISKTANLLRLEPRLVEGLSRVLAQLYVCDSRRQFRTGDQFWQAGRGVLSSEAFLMDAFKAGPEALEHASEVSVGAGIQQGSFPSGRVTSVQGAGELLRVAPFLVPFSSRAKIFQSWIAKERDTANGGQSFFPTAGRSVSVRREFIFEDAFQELNRMGPELKATIRVKFIDEHGIEEAGIDGGGVFKEFMYEVMKLGFSPHHYGFFKATPDGHLYPNPDAPVVHDNFKVQYAFLGRLLGKAVFDGVLVDIPLASFFMSKILGQFNCPNDLGSLDPELYKNMKFLKNCAPEMVESFGLNFTAANNAFGSAKEVELVPNGKNVSVTAANRIEFMHRVANYRMNTQISEQSKAFLRGFYEIVSSHYVRLFSHEELQLLISGKTGKIDLDDLRHHTRYSGGYNESTTVIKWFWEVMSELEAEDQSRLLQFVTSSPRAPLLGFSYLVPGFCIHRAEGQVRLPTASTCMNLLKLPAYPSLDVMREKLIYALKSNAGFDLS